MHTDEYYCHQDEDDQAAADLAEYEMYVLEQNRKSRALLSHPDALAVARPVAEELARLVLQHRKVRGATTLAEMLRNSICEDVLVKALEGSTAILQMAFSRAGYYPIRKSLDAACRDFEALLAADASK